MGSLDAILQPCGISTHVWDLIVAPERKRWSDVAQIAEVVNGEATTVEHALLFCHSLAYELPESPEHVKFRWLDVLHSIVTGLAIHALDVPEEGKADYERNIATGMCLEKPEPRPYNIAESVDMYARSSVTHNR